MSFDWLPLTMLVAAGIAWLWHGQLTYLKLHQRNQSSEKALKARYANLQTKAEEVAAKVHDRKSYNRLCDRFERAAKRYASSNSTAAAERNEELVEVLQKAIDIVEARYPGAQHSGMYDEADDWVPRN